LDSSLSSALAVAQKLVADQNVIIARLSQQIDSEGSRQADTRQLYHAADDERRKVSVAYQRLQIAYKKLEEEKRELEARLADPLGDHRGSSPYLQVTVQAGSASHHS